MRSSGKAETNLTNLKEHSSLNPNTNFSRLRRSPCPSTWHPLYGCSHASTPSKVQSRNGSLPAPTSKAANGNPWRSARQSPWRSQKWQMMNLLNAILDAVKKTWRWTTDSLAIDDTTSSTRKLIFSGHFAEPIVEEISYYIHYCSILKQTYR